MKLWVTRPEPAATAMVPALRAAGCDPLLAPLIGIAPSIGSARELAALDVEIARAAALIATSRNAVTALAATGRLASAVPKLLFAVGPGTADSARAAGFATIVEGPAGADALAAVIAKVIAPDAGPLVHLTGDVVAVDLAAELASRGYDTRRTVVYRQVPCPTLPDAAAAALRGGTLDAVLLMSPRTAAVYLDLTDRAGLAAAGHALLHLVLSPTIAGHLPADGRRVAAADYPNLEEMLALIRRSAAKS